MSASASAVVAARRQLHAVAESFIAGPQYRANGTIRLVSRPDGIGGAVLPVSIQGTTLLWEHGRVPLTGPVSRIARQSGLDLGPPPATVYRSVEPLAVDAVLDVDPDAAASLYQALHAGHLAVESFVRQAEPVLWPEHFDVGATADEVNYGVSAGDDFHLLPYAYVGPWNRRSGAFWNAPFGALRALDLAADLGGMAAAVSDFFEQAHEHL